MIPTNDLANTMSIWPATSFTSDGHTLDHDSSKEFRATITNDVGIELSYSWANLLDANMFSAANKGVDSLSSVFGNSNTNIAAGASLTKMIGGQADHLKFAINCKLFAYENIQRDIFDKLEKLYNMTAPDMDGAAVAQFKKKLVKVRIGNYFNLSTACILGLQHTFSKSIVDKGPAYVDLTIQFSSVFIASATEVSAAFKQTTTIKTADGSLAK